MLERENRPVSGPGEGGGCPRRGEGEPLTLQQLPQLLLLLGDLVQEELGVEVADLGGGKAPTRAVLSPSGTGTKMRGETGGHSSSPSPFPPPGSAGRWMPPALWPLQARVEPARPRRDTLHLISTPFPSLSALLLSPPYSELPGSWEMPPQRSPQGTGGNWPP